MITFDVPKQKQIRVIVDSDAKAEADDQFAIVHALLTPKLQIRGIIGAHYGHVPGTDTMEQSYGECERLISLLDMGKNIPVYRGAKEAITSDGKYEYSEGARQIVHEAMAPDSAPLFVIFQGPLTDLACAYLEHPEIAGRLTAIWIGGGAYPNGGWEFNLSNDIEAANIIFRSDIELWQIPINVYGRMLVSLTELELKVSPCGKAGAYLFQQMVDFNNKNAGRAGWPLGESWCLGDSPAVGLLLDPMLFLSESQEAPVVDERLNYYFDGKGRKIRVYKDINTRFILEDFYAKLKKYSMNGQLLEEGKNER